VRLYQTCSSVRGCLAGYFSGDGCLMSSKHPGYSVGVAEGKTHILSVSGACVIQVTYTGFIENFL